MYVFSNNDLEAIVYVEAVAIPAGLPKQKRATLLVTLFNLVEAAGIEPASASTLPSALHA